MTDIHSSYKDIIQEFKIAVDSATSSLSDREGFTDWIMENYGKYGNTPNKYICSELLKLRSQLLVVQSIFNYQHERE